MQREELSTSLPVLCSLGIDEDRLTATGAGAGEGTREMARALQRQVRFTLDSQRQPRDLRRASLPNEHATSISLPFRENWERLDHDNAALRQQMLKIAAFMHRRPELRLLIEGRGGNFAQKRALYTGLLFNNLGIDRVDHHGPDVRPQRDENAGSPLGRRVILRLRGEEAIHGRPALLDPADPLRAQAINQAAQANGFSPERIQQFRNLMAVLDAQANALDQWHRGRTFQMIKDSIFIPLTFNLDQRVLDHRNDEIKQQVLKIAAFLHRYPAYNLEIEGRSDSRGNELTNRGIAQERAEHVDSLLRSLGIDANRLPPVTSTEWKSRYKYGLHSRPSASSQFQAHPSGRPSGTA